MAIALFLVGVIFALQLYACQQAELTTIAIPSGYLGFGFIVPVCDQKGLLDRDSVYHLDSNGIVYIDTMALSGRKLRFIMDSDDITDRVEVFREDFSLDENDVKPDTPWEKFAHYEIIVNKVSNELDDTAAQDPAMYYSHRDQEEDRRMSDLIARHLLDLNRYCVKRLKSPPK